MWISSLTTRQRIGLFLALSMVLAGIHDGYAAPASGRGARRTTTTQTPTSGTPDNANPCSVAANKQICTQIGNLSQLQVCELQAALQALGKYSGKPNGQGGSATYRALVTYSQPITANGNELFCGLRTKAQAEKSTEFTEHLKSCTGKLGDNLDALCRSATPQAPPLTWRYIYNRNCI